MESNMGKILKRPQYNKMKGIIYPAVFSPNCFREALEYKAQPNDVFIVTYPKCGTTWMQNIAFYIFRKGKELENFSTQFLLHCPFIDMMGKEGIENMPRPGALKSHLPFSHLPHSPKAKYIFVARNPKDCVTSFYYHTRNIPHYQFWDAEFDDFFELFMNGEVEYNDYCDHLLSWYPHRNDANVMYTTYEEMKRDIRKVIIDLATFLGKEYIDAIENDNAVFNDILLYSGFEYMKKHLSEAYAMREGNDKVMSMECMMYQKSFGSQLNFPDNLPEMNFVRKGIVGDWKNMLSEEQSERLNKKFLARTKNTEIPNWFSLS